MSKTLSLLGSLEGKNIFFFLSVILLFVICSISSFFILCVVLNFIFGITVFIVSVVLLVIWFNYFRGVEKVKFSTCPGASKKLKCTCP